MHISDEFLTNKMNELGCNFKEEEIRCINMGSGFFASSKPLLGTMALGPCLGLLVYSKEFTYLSHIDLGNITGMSIDENIDKIRNKIDNLLEDNGTVAPLVFITVSSETFAYDKTYWNDRAILYDNKINELIDYLKEKDIVVLRLPHITSSFVVVDSRDGSIYYNYNGSCAKSNVNNLDNRLLLKEVNSSIMSKTYESVDSYSITHINDKEI